MVFHLSLNILKNIVHTEQKNTKVVDVVIYITQYVHSYENLKVSQFRQRNCCEITAQGGLYEK